MPYDNRKLLYPCIFMLLLAFRYYLLKPTSLPALPPHEQSPTCWTLKTTVYLVSMHPECVHFHSLHTARARAAAARGQKGIKRQDSQLHPEGGSLSLAKLHQFLTETLNESLLLLCLQDEQQRHDAVHHTLHICRQTGDFRVRCSGLSRLLLSNAGERQMCFSSSLTFVIVLQADITGLDDLSQVHMKPTFRVLL